jgi:hypothetical protein
MREIKRRKDDHGHWGFAVWGRAAAVVLLALGLATGCNKEKQILDKQAAIDADVGIVPTDPVLVSNLGYLTRELHHGLQRHLVATTNFADFAAACQVDVPPPPDGQKYAISKRWTIILVDAGAK